MKINIVYEPKANGFHFRASNTQYFLQILTLHRIQMSIENNNQIRIKFFSSFRFEDESCSELDEEFELPAKARVISATIGKN